MKSNTRADIRLFLTIMGELMMTAGVLVFLFIAWQLWWTDIVSGRETDAVRQELTESWASQTPAPAQTLDIPERPAFPPEEFLTREPAKHAPFALLYVPRFGEEWSPKPIVSGVDTEDLKTGVGYYPQSAAVGDLGNFAIAGHRVTYGRPFHNIEQLQVGDPIVVETDKAWFTYTMTSNTIVTPDRIDVIEPVPEQPGVEPTQRFLTMTACHPKFSAQERFVVHATLQTWQPKSAGKPAALTNASPVPSAD